MTDKNYSRPVQMSPKSPEPLVSVIVPNFNHARYVRQRIDSVLAQTFSDFELILLDDCSTDNSPDILLAYRNHPAVSQVLLNTRNSGSPFLQWEKGIRLARGRYVWIAESDDATDPDFLKVSVEQLERHPEARLCITGSHVIDSDGKPLPMEFDQWEEDGEAVIYPSREYLQTHMLKINSVYNASMAVFRREGALEALCPEFLRMHYCGDWLFWTEQIRKGAIIEIHRKLNFFRKHIANTTARGTDEGRSLGEIAFIRNRLCKEVFHDWKISLQDKYELYRTVRGWNVTSRKRHREVMREVARKGKVTWWHYRLWKLYCSYRKHILRKPELTFLDRIKG